MADGIQAALVGHDSPLEQIKILIDHHVKLERIIAKQNSKLTEQANKLSQLELLAFGAGGSGGSSNPAQNMDEEASGPQMPYAWTTNPNGIVQGDGAIEFEVVLIPFKESFKHLWEAKYRYNTRAGPQNLWTSCQKDITWLDPLIPTHKSEIHSLQECGLIQRVRVDKDTASNGDGLIKIFVDAFDGLLQEVTNLPPSQSLAAKVTEYWEDEMDMVGPPLPDWVHGFKSSIVPLKLAMSNPKVLEYLPMTTMKQAPAWNLTFFDRPFMSQNVMDSKTGATVRRVFFTTVEGYLGFTNNYFDLGTWGMRPE